MSLFKKSVAVFDNYDADAFRSLHHNDFMFYRDEITNLDQHCEVMNELCKDPDFHPLKNAELIHENEYTLEMRWEANGEIVTNLTLKKDGLYWKAMVSRIPIKN